MVIGISLSISDSQGLSGLKLCSHVPGGALESVESGEVIVGNVVVLGDRDGGEVTSGVIEGALALDVWVMEYWEDGGGPMELILSYHLVVWVLEAIDIGHGATGDVGHVW